MMRTINNSIQLSAWSEPIFDHVDMVRILKAAIYDDKDRQEDEKRPDILVADKEGVKYPKNVQCKWCKVTKRFETLEKKNKHQLECNKRVVLSKQDIYAIKVIDKIYQKKLKKEEKKQKKKEKKERKLSMQRGVPTLHHELAPPPNIHFVKTNNKI